MPKQILKEGQRIKMPSVRAERVYQDAVIDNLVYRADSPVFVEMDNTLIYQFTDQDKVVFKNCKKYSVPNAAYAVDGLLIAFDINIFHLSNYIVL